MMQLFKYDHPPPHLQVVSRPFGELAAFVDSLPALGDACAEAEKEAALRKLLEAKDAAVRVTVAARAARPSEAPR